MKPERIAEDKGIEPFSLNHLYVPYVPYVPCVAAEKPQS